MPCLADTSFCVKKINVSIIYEFIGQKHHHLLKGAGFFLYFICNFKINGQPLINFCESLYYHKVILKYLEA